MTTTSQEPNNGKKVWNIVKWIIGVFLILGGIGFFSQSFLAGLLVLIAGLLIIPLISEWLKIKISIWGKKPVRIMVPIALFLIGALLSNPNISEETTGKSESSKPEIPKWEIEISAMELHEAYVENEVAADNQYKGKKIAVTGKIDNIAKNAFDKIYVTLNTGDLFGGMRCDFLDKNSDEVSKLNKNQRVTIIGKCDGFFMRSVTMKNCEILKE